MTMGPGVGGAAAGPVELRERPLSLRGRVWARWLLRLAGWRLLCDGLPAAQGVAVVYPHTSNWDFVIGMLAKWGVGLPVTFWGKASLFRLPLFGRWLRWLGGLPVRRDAPGGAVRQMVNDMQQAVREHRFMWLALSPEGTRRRTEGWRSGFYRVAVDAGVPVGLVRLDFARREVGFDSFWQLSGHVPADFAVLSERLSGCTGRHPAWAAPITPLEKR